MPARAIVLGCPAGLRDVCSRYWARKGRHVASVSGNLAGMPAAQMPPGQPGHQDEERHARE